MSTQRLKSSAATHFSKSLASTLTPTASVPYAASRDVVPAEWAWCEPSRPSTAATPGATFAPQGYEPGYNYPLLVWLHGDGASEGSLPTVMRHVSVRNFVAVAPRGTQELREGYGWRQTAHGVGAAEDAVFDVVESVERTFSVNPRRVFLCGVGTGGAMAMRVALSNPDRFAGAATLDGALPTGGRLLARVNQLRSLPLLLSSSRASLSYPEARLCRDLALLHSAGCRVAVRQYPGDDDLTTAMLADLNRWAMEIVCGV